MPGLVGNPRDRFCHKSANIYSLNGDYELQQHKDLQPPVITFMWSAVQPSVAGMSSMMRYSSITLSVVVSSIVQVQLMLSSEMASTNANSPPR